MCFIGNETLKILLFTTFAGICLLADPQNKRLTFLENENLQSKRPA
jgi:hypothetical protein